MKLFNESLLLARDYQLVIVYAIVIVGKFLLKGQVFEHLLIFGNSNVTVTGSFFYLTIFEFLGTKHFKYMNIYTWNIEKK